MTRRRSSPLGLELVVSVVLALVVMPLFSHGAPVQDAHAELQRYSEGCYYNYNHYSEGDRILTNEPCLNCTCHNKMLMCYLRVCPFTKPIGHDCTVEKREDQCCPIITCPEVPVDVSHHTTQLTTYAPGTEMSILAKYGCNIDSKFYPEGAQLPSNPNKPCELCYCIRNRTSCLMQECTLHIDGCQPIYNKGSCCPVRYNCDHENELLELEDYSTTTTTIRPTPGYILTSTTSPVVSTDCVHNKEVYADGASIAGKNACEHCYCMRGDIVCAVQECEMPTLESGAKTCRALPPLTGECCPSNYICEDDVVLTEAALLEGTITTIAPKIQGDLHESVSHEDVELQEHIDDKIAVTEAPEKDEEHLDVEQGSGDDKIAGQAPGTTIAPIVSEIEKSSAEKDKKSENEEEEALSRITTTVSAIKDAGYETTQSPIEIAAIQKTEEGLDVSHIILDQDKEYDSTQAPVAQDVITDEKEAPIAAVPAIEEKQKEDEAAKVGDDESGQDVTTSSAESSSEEEEIKKDILTTVSPTDQRKPEQPIEKDVIEEQGQLVTVAPIVKIELEDAEKPQATEVPTKAGITPEISVEEDQPYTPSSSAPSKAHISPETSTEEEQETSSEIAELPTASDKPTEDQDKIDEIERSTSSPVYEMVTEGEDSDIVMPEIGDHKAETADFEKKPKGETDAPSVPVVSSVDSVTKDELSQVPVEGTTIRAAISKTEETITSKPVSEDRESSTETQQTLSAIPSTSTTQQEEVTETSFEDSQKPISEEDGIPATVQEISETTSKPVSEAVPKGEDEIKDQTTVLPPKEFGAEEVSEIEESEEGQTSSEEGEVQSTESSEDTQKEIVKATTAIPIEVSVGEKDAPTIVPLKDSATDLEAPFDDKEQKVKGKPEEDSTSIVPSLSEVLSEMSESEDSQEQSEEEVADLTTSRPTITDSKIPAAEVEKDKEDTEPSLDESTTAAPSPIDAEEPSSEENKIEPKPDSAPEAPIQQGIDFKLEQGSELPSEISTAIPSKDLIPESSTQFPEKDVTTMATPAADFEQEGSGEEIKEQQEQKPSAEEDLKEKPEEESATDVPSLADLDLPISQEEESEVDESKRKPEQGIVDSSTVSAESESKPSEEEEEEIGGQKKQVIVDFTTINPSVSDAGLPSQVEINDKKQEIAVTSSLEKDTEEEEEKITQKPKQEFTGLTTLSPVAESEGPIVDIKPVEVKAEADSTTAIPSVTGVEEQSVEEVDDVKEQPDQSLPDLTTLSPSVSDSKVPITLEENLGVVDAITTVEPSAAESIAESEEEEDAKKRPAQDIAEKTTISPSVADTEAPSSEKDKFEGEPDRGIIDSATALPIIPDLFVPVDEKEEQMKEQQTTISPSAIDSHSEQPSSEIDVSKPEQEDIHRTTVSPIYSSEEESSEVIEAGEGSGEQPNEIIPSAIPGEGDCLVNNKTYVNNATIPTANECELSCSCVSSIVVCQRVQCHDPPQPNNCVLDESSTDKCCPQYICGVDSFALDQRPTIAEDVEDEEISFTTLPPERKYPMVSSKPELEKEEPLKPSATTVASIDKSEDNVSEEESLEDTTQKPEIEPIKPGATDSEEPILKPIDEDIPAKSEQPALLEEISAPSSVDIEMPLVTPEEPMSHVKGDSGEDESTEISSSAEGSGDEDIISEKPQVSDTEKPVQTAVFEADLPSKKTPGAEESTTLKLAEEQESATISPLAPGGSSVDDSVTIDTQTELDESQVITTKSPIGVGAPKIDESIFAGEEDLESVSSTSKPADAAAESEAPSLSSVLGSEEMDSSHSEESEGNEQGSGESAEESEETNKPLTPKEEESPASTASPIQTEQSTVKIIHTDLAGEIKPIESSTIIPEVEYQKPEIPEDLSHTKVEVESPLEKDTKKPVQSVQPVSVEESDKSEESTEKPLEIIPPKIPDSTILSPVSPVEEGQDKLDVPTGISDKKDDFAATKPKGEDHSIEQISIQQNQPLSPATDSSTSGEESLSGTATPISAVESEQKKDQAGIPAVVELSLPVASISDEKSETENEEIASQTSAPTIAEQTPPGTVAPVLEGESEEEEEDILSQTSAPAVSEHTPSGTVAPDVKGESEEEKEDVLSQTSSPAVEESASTGTDAPAVEEEKEDLTSQTSAPVFTGQPISGPVAHIPEDESEQGKKKILSPTIAPVYAEPAPSGTVAPGVEEEKEYVLSHTSAPIAAEQAPSGPVSPILGEELEGEKEGVLSQTSSPTIAEQPISELVPSVLEKEPTKEEDIPSQTSVPAVTEQALPETSAPISDQDSDEEREEIPSQTSAPITAHDASISEEVSKEEEILGQTSTPAVANLPGTVAPELEKESEEEKEEILNQTSTPVIGEQPISGPVAPIPEEEKEEALNQTSAPAVAEQELLATVVPVLEKESEEKVPSQTSAPGIAEQTLSGALPAEESGEESDEILSQTGAPAVDKKIIEASIAESESDEKEDEITRPTEAPVLEEGTVVTPSADIYGEISGQTIAPSVDEQIQSGSPTQTGLESQDESEDGLVATTASEEKPLSASSESESEEEQKEIETQTLTSGQKLDESIISKPAQTTVSPSIEESDNSLSTVSSSEEEEAVVSETAEPVTEDKKPSVQEEEYEANIFSSTPSPVEGIEAGEEEAAPIDKPQIVLPVKPLQSIDAESDTTAAPVTSKPVKSDAMEDEDLDTSESPEVGDSDITEVPMKSVEKEIDVSLSPVDLTTQALPLSEEDESIEGTTAPPSIAQAPESEPPSPVNILVSVTEKKEEGTTQIPVDLLPSKADRGTEEKLSTEQTLSPIVGQVSDDKEQQLDKTLVQSESPQAAGETISPLPAEGMTGEKIEQPGPELISSDETESPVTNANLPVAPEDVVVDEVTSMPAGLDSGDQVSVDKVSLESGKPTADDIPASTESSIGEKPSESAEKEQTLEEALSEDEKPSSVVKLDSEEVTTQTEKPKESDIPSVVAEKVSEIPSVEISTEEPAVQTESPNSVPLITEVEKPEAVETPAQTEQPGSLEGSAEGPDDEQVIQESPIKPAVPVSTSESEEEVKKEIISTAAPIDLAQTNATPASEVPVAPVDSESSTSSTEASKEESGQTEAPKIQTVAEFVSERGDELTTSVPILDTKNEEIPQHTVVQSSEETTTTSSEEVEEDGENGVPAEVPTTAQKVVPGIIEENESEEKTQAPEVESSVESEEEQKLEEPASEKPITPVDSKFDSELPKPVESIKESSEDKEETPVLSTTAHPLFPSIGLNRTTLRPTFNASDKVDDEIPISATTARPVYLPSSTLPPTTLQSTTPQAVTSAPTSHYQQPTYGHVPPQYPTYTEDEYTDEDETEVFGPGTCRYGGKLFVSAQQIPRDDPCDFCFCFRSDIICLQQSCPPPISGCHEEPINGFCCPRYECPVSMATVLNITTSTTTTSTTLPPHFLHHAYRGAAEKNGCHISGKSYRVGDKIDSASGPCMHCTCGGDGQMKCDPKTCSPEPMLRQMIAVVASRRR